MNNFCILLLALFFSALFGAEKSPLVLGPTNQPTQLTSADVIRLPSAGPFYTGLYPTATANRDIYFPDADTYLAGLSVSNTWLSPQAFTTGTTTITTADINGGTVDGTIIGVTVPASGTFTTGTIATADINGGAIDGTTVGLAVPSTGAFTDVDLNGDLTQTGTGTFSTGTGAVALNGDVTAGNVTITGTLDPGTVVVDDDAFTVRSGTDPTKLFQFSASAISPSTTRTYGVPDADTALAGLSVSQTWGATQTFAGVTATSVTNSGLTSGRIPFSSTGGLQVDDDKLLFSSGNLTLGNNTSAGGVIYNGASGAVKSINVVQRAGVTAWGVFVRDATDDYRIRAYDDAGSAIDYPLTIARASGGAVTIVRPVTISNTLAVVTSAHIGDGANTPTLTSLLHVDKAAAGSAILTLQNAAYELAFGCTTATFFGSRSATDLYLQRGGTNVVQLGSSGMSAYADTDALNSLGRAKVGYYGTSDIAAFAHYDFMTSTGFALRQNNTGGTRLNTASGQTLELAVASTNVATLTASAITLIQPVTCSSTLSATTLTANNGNVSNRITIGNSTNGYASLALLTGSTHFGWMIGAQYNVSETLEITPSTVAGGTTFTNPSATFDKSTTAGNTRFSLYDVDTGAVQRVTVGAADSGGSGFKVLRIPN